MIICCGKLGLRRHCWLVTNGRPRHRWEENIKMDLQEVGWGGIWAGLIRLRIGTGGRLL